MNKFKSLVMIEKIMLIILLIASVLALASSYEDHNKTTEFSNMIEQMATQAKKNSK